MAKEKSVPRKGQVKPAKEVTPEVTPEKKPMPELKPRQRSRNPRGW
jgi:hypothetical protein